MQNNPLSKEMAAAIQVRLPKTALRLADKMRYVEYQDPESLNELVNNYKQWQEYGFDGIDIYKNILMSSSQDIKNILNNKPPVGMFEAHLKEHDRIAKQMIKEYEKNNKKFLDFSYGRFVG